MEKLITRNMHKMFIGVSTTSGSTTTTKYVRLTGFTSLSESKSTTEYSRRYVDEPTERTDTTAMSSAYSYTFDKFTPQEGLAEFIKVHDQELIGSDAVYTFLDVHFEEAGTATGSYKAIKREYAIVPSASGDSTDAMTYSGDLKSHGVATEVEVTISAPSSGGTPDNVQEVTISA